MAAYIRCNELRVLVDLQARRPVAEWGSEQCEGCGVDICESGELVSRGEWFGGVVRCRECGATYAVRTVPA